MKRVNLKFSAKRRMLLSAACFVVFTCACFAQDVIVTKDSKKIDAKVTEVNAGDIKYKRFDNPDGPTYTLSKSDIVTIVYQNGQVETFESASGTSEQALTQKTEKTPVQTSEQTPVQTSAHATAQTPVQAYNSGVTQKSGDLSDAELRQRMAVNAPALYNKYKSASTMRNAGMGMTLGGVAAIIIGIATADKETIQDGAYTQVNLSGPGAGIFAIGIVSSIVGTPLWIIGGAKKKNTRNAYIRDFGYSFQAPVHPSPYLQLHAATNRLGLALVF